MDDLKTPDASEPTILDYYAYSQILSALSKDARETLSNPREFAKELRIGAELGDLEAEALKPCAALEIDAFRRSQEAALRALFGFLLEKPVEQLKNALEKRLYPTDQGDAKPSEPEVPVLPHIARAGLFMYIAHLLRNHAKKKQSQEYVLANLQTNICKEVEGILNDKTVQERIHHDANQRANSAGYKEQSIEDHVRDVVVERLLGIADSAHGVMETATEAPHCQI